MRIGDRLLVNEDRRLTTSFMPSSPDDQVEGKMISVDGGVTQIGQYNVVAINRGSREGLKAGNVMAVLKSGNFVRDPITKETVELPSERAGLLMVFQVYEKIELWPDLAGHSPAVSGRETRLLTPDSIAG